MASQAIRVPLPLLLGCVAFLTSQPATAGPAKKLQVRQERDQTQEEIAARRKKWRAKLSKRLGRPAERIINIRNGWTSEVLPFSRSQADHKRQDTVDQFLRCRFTNRTRTMDPRVLYGVVSGANYFGKSLVVINSAYRSPKHNLVLQKKGGRVSRTSQHIMGRALDFRIPGVSVSRLHQWARKQGLGGVGYYPKDGFIHMDTWKVRYWTSD